VIGFARGQRIRVKKDNGRDGVVGFEGTVKQIAPSGLVVQLDHDPALGRNMYNPGGFARTPKSHQVFRFFFPYEVELVET
jgi:hypothetical protein